MNKIITISGRSTSGKSTLESMLIEQYPEEFSKIISHTTRTKRIGEVDGVDYYFIKEQELLDIDMMEIVQFDNNMYGASEDEFKRIFKMNKIPVVVVTPEGAQEIEENCVKNGWHCVTVFLDTPIDILLERFHARFSAEVENSSDRKHTNNIYESRLKRLHGEESNWINYVEWTHKFNEFTERTDKVIVNTLLGHVE